MLKRMVLGTFLFVALFMVVTQVVIPRARSGRQDHEARLARLQMGREIVIRACTAVGGVQAWLAKSDVRFHRDEVATVLGRLLALRSPAGNEAEYELFLHRGLARVNGTTGRDEVNLGLYESSPWATRNGVVESRYISQADYVLGTSRFFFELPFSLLEKGAYPEFVKEVTRDGRRYDRVKISFGLGSGNYPADHYQADFDQESGRLAFLEFTIKDRLPSLVQLCASFSDYQEFQGLWVPMAVRIATAEPLAGLELLRWRLSAVQFDVGLLERDFIPSYFSAAELARQRPVVEGSGS